jgi:uncharacterized membrane protein YjgN (DUF898 family)
MGLSPQDALAALNDVEAADARARASQANRAGAPYLLIWGAVWVVGYVLSGLLPGKLIGPTWLGVSLVGVVAMGLLPRRTGADAKDRGLAMTICYLAIFAFIGATYWVMRPTQGDQYMVYPALMVGLIYTLMGSLRRTRIMWIGAAVFVLSLIGYAFLRPVLPFWLAAVGGGGLILGGLWLRRP